MKELAPTTELRKWFAHDPAKWAAFKRKYAKELQQHSEEVRKLAAMARRGVVTLVFGAQDPEHNNAVALREYLRKKPTGRRSARFIEP